MGTRALALHPLQGVYWVFVLLAVPHRKRSVQSAKSVVKELPPSSPRGAVLVLVICNKVTKGWEILHPQNIVHVRTLPYLCVAYLLYDVTVNKDT